MESDAELVDRIGRGEHQVFAVLVERYERLARATALQVLRDTHLAEDVAQEAFIAAFESLPSLRSSSRFGTWLLSIVRRLAARTLRTRQRRPTVEVHADSVVVATNGRPSEESMELLAAISQLPDHERVVIGLRHFDGNSVEDVSRITGRTVGTVTKQLSRAHKRLRKWLQEEDLT